MKNLLFNSKFVRSWPPQFVLVILSAASILLCGCRSFTSPARQRDVSNGVRWIDYDATRRGAYLVTSQNPNMRVLAEQSPDAALGVVAEFVAKGSYQGISADASAKVTETISELGKRTQTVMVLREALYRLNELGINNAQMTPTDIKELYKKILETTVKIAEADLAYANAAPAKAAADRADAEAKKASEINKTLETLATPKLREQFLHKMGLQ